MTSSPMPARARRSIVQAITGLPRTESRGLGRVSVSGRRRSPRPAARTIAFMQLPFAGSSKRVPRLALLVRELAEQIRERRELGVARTSAPEIAHHQRLVL